MNKTLFLFVGILSSSHILAKPVRRLDGHYVSTCKWQGFDETSALSYRSYLTFEHGSYESRTVLYRDSSCTKEVKNQNPKITKGDYEIGEILQNRKYPAGEAYFIKIFIEGRTYKGCFYRDRFLDKEALFIKFSMGEDSSCSLIEAESYISLEE